MRIITGALLLFFLHEEIRAQQAVSPIEAIKDKIEIIENYAASEQIYLDPEEFLTKMPDHGAELIGYYEYNQLKKIIKKIGVRKAMLKTTYYFSGDQLIYVLYEQEEYLKVKNPDGSVSRDYDQTNIKYRLHRYFQAKNEFKKQEDGTPIPDIVPEEVSIAYVDKMKRLLDNKYYNKDTYNSLQGRWQQTDYEENIVVFDETTQIILRNKKFFEKRRVTITDGIMSCKSVNSDIVYKYEIVSIDEELLKLKDLQNQSEHIEITFVKQ
ncbi:hypothetical protein NBT05_16040 [Aquimarina sp. ERC-38]|uniref:hypothetical protein n=1 Tax=Aquimarina sp. ERC-38 TaxID=2949996 RepID=UPI002247384D|nr:hypothetical protein [Aquimarina sp. ERC-38]UZO80449.1 hypothetical protein NBT05_16040 [Aquimarina sp. ERC-38]